MGRPIQTRHAPFPFQCGRAFALRHLRLILALLVVLTLVPDNCAAAGRPCTGLHCDGAPPSSVVLPSLFDSGVARLRLCLPRYAPFSFGTFHFGEQMGRLTVFEAEIVHGAEAGQYPDRAVLGLQQGPVQSGYVQLLMLVDNVASIQRSQNEGEGLAFSVNTDTDIPIRFLCEYWLGNTGLDRLDQDKPLFEAVAVRGGPKEWPGPNYFELIHCPLPMDSSSPLMTAPFFQVLLRPADPNTTIVHCDALPLCRTDSGLSPECNPNRLNPLRLFLQSPDTALQQIRAEEAAEKLRRSRKNTERTRVSICIPPFADHRLFTETPNRDPSMSRMRVKEFIDYHLLLGFERIYFYDRYGEDYMDHVQPYIFSGVVMHVPFPLFTEVFYRKETYQNAKYPEFFPQLYDHMIASYHCLMQGRRNNDKWMLQVDTTEFLLYPDAPNAQPVGKVLLDLEQKQRPGPLSAITVHRYNIFTQNNLNTTVLGSNVLRCTNIMKIARLNGFHDKVIVKPWRMLGGDVYLHHIRFLPDSEVLAGASLNSIRIHFYNTAYYNCDQDERMEDSSLVWASHQLLQCNQEAKGFTLCSESCRLLCNIHQ